MASPFPAENPRDEMEVIGPAVDGTKNVLEACAKTKGGVKRVVLTSSCAAIYCKGARELCELMDGQLFFEGLWGWSGGGNVFFSHFGLCRIFFWWAKRKLDTGLGQWKAPALI